MTTQTILVTGATGNVGRHVATQLTAAGVTVRALSRDPSSSRLPAGVTAVPGDLTDPDSVRNAAAGADAAFLLWPFLTAQGAEAAVGAIAGQVRRIVYLSAISVHDGAPPEENGVWGQVEQVIRQSGAEWTLLRAGGFAANALGWADQIRSDGVVRWAYGQAARSLIHERDIADVAVRALTDGKHAGAPYVLTGPEAVTQADHSPNDCRRLQIASEIHHESAVDLDLVEWKRLKIAQRRITAAEITHGNAHAERLQPPQQRQTAVEILDQHALGDFQLEPARRQAGFEKDRMHQADQIAMHELRRRQVDRDLQRYRP